MLRTPGLNPHDTAAMVEKLLLRNK